MEGLNREAGYGEIKQWIWERYPGVNPSSITCEIITGSVNHPSRIHYPPNKKVRPANGPRDFLFYTKRGFVAPYDPEKHGLWEIAEGGDGSLCVRLISEGSGLEPGGATDPEETSSLFALEAHLRDYIAKNLSKLGGISTKLSLYESEDGRSGVEFQTEVGPIDVLARDEEGRFHVFELKLSRGPDSALGQIQRYMGWTKKHLAGGKEVQGVIVAAEMSEKLRYAVMCAPNVRLFAYKLSFEVQPVPVIEC